MDTSSTKPIPSNGHARTRTAVAKEFGVPERKLGEMLGGMELHGGDRKSKFHDETLNLDDLGISKGQSHRWQTGLVRRSM